VDGGDELRLFGKYGGRDHSSFGHRGGVEYEAEVYRRILAPSALPAPRFYGAGPAGPAGEVWLAIGHLDHAIRLQHTPDPRVWEQAARWVGRFHAEHEARSADPAVAFLNVYDAAYYLGWAHRTAEWAAAQGADFSWLAHLSRRAEALLPGLLDGPRTVIHGEYYPRNIVHQDGIVYPVDWESAAVARGEIDLATLTDGDAPELVAPCEAAYQSARWPDGAPPDFTPNLERARLYIHLRWLGSTGEIKPKHRARRCNHARALGERMGLI
jgi:aminoglycoside phosphotransferase (APT) family kinase protein